MKKESRAIYSALDKSGVNVEFVKWCVRNAEAINAFDGLKYKLFGVDLEVCTIGSFSDGTYREWLQSDVDCLHIYNHGLVYEDPDKIHWDNCHLMFTDETTRPGYVKLKVLNNNTTKQAGTITDDKSYEEFIFHKTDSFALNGELKTNKRMKGSSSIYKIDFHGPAEKNTSPSLVNVEENIFAYRCGCMLEVARTWLNRCRNKGWPSTDHLEKLEKIPCHVVPMGHPHSEEREREVQWKLSFTLHEQYIMTNLNETQLKCFFLLKIFKEEIIKPATKEFEMTNRNKGLKTYHCKTALLYTIQEHDQRIWIPDKLVVCFMLCLDRLLQWLENRFLPDFYIPQANLLDGKIEDEAHQNRIIELINSVLIDPLHMLKNIELQSLGEYVISSLCSNKQKLSKICDDIENDCAKHFFFYLVKTAVSGFDMCGFGLYYISEKSKNILEAVKNHFYIMDIFMSVMKDQNEDIQITLKQAIGYIHVSLGSHLVSLAMGSDPSHIDWFVFASAMHFAKGLEYNVAAGKLKLATVLLVTGHHKSAKYILDNFDKNFDENTQCINFGMAAPTSEKEAKFCISRLRAVGLENILHLPCSLLMQQFLSAPVLFLPTEIGITPDALKLEMFRSIATEPGSMVQHLQYWYNWASVDVSVMSPFLKYLAKHNMDLRLLHESINTCVSMNNYETPQNLLGWAAMNENKTYLAVMYFLESWKICCRRTENLCEVFKIEKKLLQEHNAAKLWMLVLIIRQMKNYQDMLSTSQETTVVLYSRRTKEHELETRPTSTEQETAEIIYCRIIGQ